MTTTDLKLFAAGPGTTLDPDSFGPRGCRGVDKVAQRAVYALLTPLGSVPGRPTLGSSFLDTVVAYRSEFEVYGAFAGCLTEIEQTVRAAEAADDPAAEKLNQVRLLAVTAADTGVTLTLSVSTLDGAAASGIEFSLEL